ELQRSLSRTTEITITVAVAPQEAAMIDQGLARLAVGGQRFKLLNHRVAFLLTPLLTHRCRLCRSDPVSSVLRLKLTARFPRSRRYSFRNCASHPRSSLAPNPPCLMMSWKQRILTAGYLRVGNNLLCYFLFNTTAARGNPIIGFAVIAKGLDQPRP